MLENCEPKQVFYYFEEITKIPHGSGNTKKISEYLVNFAKEKKLKYKQDSLGNVIIWKKASKGYEGEAPVILQGHMDMVAVKDADCPLELLKDGLDIAVDGDYVYAKGTSLGGDDGIAVAYALAILADDTKSHPPLEVVITVDEETGMEGAKGIDLSECKAKLFLNLDSEEEGEFIVSCAGGSRVRASLAINGEEAEGICYGMELCGLTGGHSGADIHFNRANANILMGEILSSLYQKYHVTLCTIEGGTKDNAIPVSAKAVFVVEGCPEEKIVQEICHIERKMQEKCHSTDPSLSLKVKRVKSEKAMGEETTRQILAILTKCPNGVVAMSQDIPDLVETSLNLGVISMTGQEIHFDFSLRSSVKKEKEKLAERLCTLLKEAGASCERSGDYPAWEYRKDSPLRDKMVKTYRDMYKKEPKVLALHAGLECGIMAEKIEGLDCVSFGPDILDIHTTRERLCISSVKRVWEFLLEILQIRRNVVLIGMPGAGKSTVGVVLAKNLGYRFVDSDLVMQEQSGKLLHEMIAERGIEGFWEYEDEVNASLYENKCVIATGGSAVFGAHAMEHLGRIGTIVYLKLPYEEIEERLGDLAERGVTVREGQTLKELYEERSPLYEKYAGITVDCTHKSIREIVSQIRSVLPFC